MPLTNPENLTNTVQLLQWMNTVSDQRLGVAMLIVFGLTTFLTLKTYESEKAFAAASFVIGLLSCFFAFIGIVSMSITLLCVVFAAIGLFMLVWRD